MRLIYTLLFISFFAFTSFAQLTFNRIGGISSLSGAEIVAYDPGSQQLFATSGSGLQVIDFSNPATPSVTTTIIPTNLGAGFNSNGITSVSVSNGIVAAALPNVNQQAPGNVLFFDANNLAYLGSVVVGALPDMVTFSPDGTKVLVANEGQPDGVVDPDGSVTIIDISGGVVSATATTVSLGTAPLVGDVRIFPGKTQAEDLEPEYITFSEDGSTAYVALQENNAMAIIDVNAATAVSIVGLGAKDHSLPGNGLDPSDEDGPGGSGLINIVNQPVFGLYMPDGIAGFTLNGTDYIVTANEGDSRDEDERIKDVTLDPTAFPNAATLQDDAVLGRLEISTIDGDLEPDGDFDQLFAYGARSFSIWQRSGNNLIRVYDSGDDLEQITAMETPAIFNADEANPGNFDNRSDNKGPEPEAVKVVDLGIRKYAFVGLERAGGGFLVYDINNPAFPKYITYIRHSGDIALEGLIIISEADSPTGQPLVVTANEVSNSISVFSIDVDVEAQLVADIPTMGQWSFLLFGLILINVCVALLYQHKAVLKR